MELRPFQETDFDQLITAWRAASVVAHPFLTPDFLDAEVDSIRDMYLPAAETWVAMNGETVVGFLALLGDEIGAIFVHPNHWRNGIGRALMDKAASLRDKLTLEVFEENEIGRAFYKRYGFTEGGHSVHGVTGRPLIRMELTSTSNRPSGR